MRAALLKHPMAYARDMRSGILDELNVGRG